MPVQQMLQTHPSPSTVEQDKLVACIEACAECAQTCTTCADACLAEDNVAEMRDCIRLDQDCADVCTTTAAVLSRQTAPNMPLITRLLEACAVACGESAAECERHAQHHEHCRICAETCRRCETACNELLRAMGEARRLAA